MNVVFPLVIHSGTCTPCSHLFISNASLRWMEVNFLNQKPCIPSWPVVFQFDILFSVVLSKSMCISVLGPSSSPSSSLVMLFIHSAFSLCFLVAIFLSKIVRFLLHPVLDMFSCQSFPNVDRIFFRFFGKSRFVSIVLSFVDISLIFLLSPALSGLFSQVVLYFFLCWPFLFPAYFSASHRLILHLHRLVHLTR